VGFEFLPEGTPEAVQLGAESVLIPAGPFREGDELAMRRIAIEEGAEIGEFLPLARLFPLGFETAHGQSDEVQGPLAVEFLIGGKPQRIGWVESGIGVGRSLDGQVREVASAFPGGGTFTLVENEVLERTEEVGTEAGTLPFQCGESIAGEQPSEEVVGEIAGFVIASAFLFEEPYHRSVVGFAKFTECDAGVFGFALCGDDAGPLRGQKGIVAHDGRAVFALLDFRIRMIAAVEKKRLAPKDQNRCPPFGSCNSSGFAFSSW
jgi:hypothetical protein